MKFLNLLLVIIISLIILCSCSGPTGPLGPEGPQGAQGIQGEVGPQGEQGPAGKDGASFLTGKGSPSSDLGNIGDSYLDLSDGKWGFYVKDEFGWKLMGYIKTEPAPLTINDLNGSYVLSHVVSGSRIYNIGDKYAGFTLSSDMIKVELNDGVGNLAVNFGSLQASNITCSIEDKKLIMICENAINITGQPSSIYELSIVQDDELYVVLEAYGDFYYVKKLDNSDVSDNSSQNKNNDIDIILHAEDADINITENGNLFSDILWEPGKSQTVYFSVKNNSSTNLNYMISIETTNIVNNLNEVIAYIITPNATLNNPVSNGSIDWSTGNYFASGSNIVTQETTLKSGEEYFFAISLHMDTTASNAYQNGDISFNIEVVKGNTN